MCEVHDVYGFQGQVADGGMAEYMRLSARAVVHRIPESVAFEDAAITEPLSCAIHAVNRGDIQLDDVVVIAGAGTLGLLMAQVARLKTPRRLVVMDLSDQRLALARRCGADVTINPAREDARAIVHALTDGYGCDVYIETTGAPSGVTQGLDLGRKLGRFVEFSVFGRETTVDWSIIGEEKELDLRGAHLSAHCYPIAIDLLARKARFDVVISDYAMPGMNGVELAEHIAQRYPGLNFILASGFADIPALPPGMTRLAKPYSQEDLSQLLHQLMRA